jgi:hypothetical protein
MTGEAEKAGRTFRATTDLAMRSSEAFDSLVDELRYSLNAGGIQFETGAGAPFLVAHRTQ